MRNHLYECEGAASMRMIKAKFSKALMKLPGDAQGQNGHNNENQFCGLGKLCVIIIVLAYANS